MQFINKLPFLGHESANKVSKMNAFWVKFPVEFELSSWGGWSISYDTVIINATTKTNLKKKKKKHFQTSCLTITTKQCSVSFHRNICYISVIFDVRENGLRHLDVDFSGLKTRIFASWKWSRKCAIVWNRRPWHGCRISWIISESDGWRGDRENITYSKKKYKWN